MRRKPRLRRAPASSSTVDDSSIRNTGGSNSDAAPPLTKTTRAQLRWPIPAASLAFLFVCALVLLTGPLDQGRRPNAPLPAEWNQDYSRRLRAALSRGRSRPHQTYLRWLHVPKTGTSFANTLIRWGCPTAPASTFVVPRKERPPSLQLPLNETISWDWLVLNDAGRAWLRLNCPDRLVTRRSNKIAYSLNMHRAPSAWEIPHAVAMFRLPKQRAYSNYVHLTQHYNENSAPRQSLASFLNRSEFHSQHAKLLLGRHYRDAKKVTAEEAERAVNVVHRLRFVGLTEHFQLSTRLFHAMFGGIPHRAQFENVRPGIARYREPSAKSDAFRYDEALFGAWTDAADDAVYSAARTRFWNDICKYSDQIELDGLGPIDAIPPPS